MADHQQQTAIVICSACGTQVAPGLLACPGCRRLVHADDLKRLAAEAEQAARADDLSTALAAWRRAMELLPAGSRQFDAVAAKVNELSGKLGAANGTSTSVEDGGVPTSTPEHGRSPTDKKHSTGWKKGVVGLGGIALLLWKLKFVLVFVLTKAKFLFLGLTKAKTFFSMILALGVYWTAFGWKFALGLVVSIYIHEMGHVWMLRRYGIKATAPMFIPGLGALIRLKQAPANVVEDNRIGLAGPIWGLGAAIGAYLVFLATGWASWAAIARVGAWINLFNLLPVWQLDGSRGFASMTRRHRWMAVAAIAVAWFATAEGMLVLILIVAVIRAAATKPVERPDPIGLLLYIGLLGVLSAMCLIPVPMGALE